jgi:hypothetical protein
MKVLSVAVVVGTLTASAGQVGRHADLATIEKSSSWTSPQRCREILWR